MSESPALVLRRREPPLSGILHLILGVACAGGLVVWLAPRYEALSYLPAFAVALFIAWLLGAGIAYYGLAKLVGSTIVTIDAESVRIETRPLPLGGIRLPRDPQLRFATSGSQRKPGPFFASLVASSPHQHRITVLAGLTPSEASYLASAITTRLSVSP